jgi:ankyrin repeat protein
MRDKALQAGDMSVDIEALIAAIGGRRFADVETALDRDPSLAAQRSADGVSPLSMAVYTGDQRTIKLLRGLRTKPDFFEACLAGDEAAVRQFVAAGQDVNDYAPDGYTPLGLAAFFGHSTIARYLLDLRADPNQRARNKQQVAAIHAVAARGDLPLLELMLVRGADVNLPQQLSFRPIHATAGNGNIAATALLVLFNADTMVRTDDGHSPSDLARANGHLALAAQLERFAENRRLG